MADDEKAAAPAKDADPSKDAAERADTHDDSRTHMTPHPKTDWGSAKGQDDE